MRLKRTTPDKLNGKLVKYRKGDCLSFLCKNGNYLGAIVSDKYNAYYDITLIQYYESHKPQLSEFVNGKYFGTRFGSVDEIQYAVNYRMMKCKYIDDNTNIENVKIKFAELIFEQKLHETKSPIFKAVGLKKNHGKENRMGHFYDSVFGDGGFRLGYGSDWNSRAFRSLSGGCDCSQSIRASGVFRKKAFRC